MVVFGQFSLAQAFRDRPVYMLLFFKGLQRFISPKGLCKVAQGCRAAATLGQVHK